MSKSEQEVNKVVRLKETNQLLASKRHPLKPIILKEVLIRSGSTQVDAATFAGVNKATLNVCLNRGMVYMPQVEGFKEKIEQFVAKHCAAYLAANSLKVADIWKPAAESNFKMKAMGTGKKIADARHNKALLPGDPGEIKTSSEVRELLTGETLRHFKLFRSPFNNDIRDVPDIYMSEEHRYIEAAMIDASKHGGFLAIIGEVGSGKSVIRKKVVAELSKDDSSRIIFPRMIDKTRITAASLCDAIIMDLSDEHPKMRLEQKTRQVERLLIARSKAGCHVCLMIEEAHDLSVRVLKLLKRFYEIEDGYKKAIGIVLIGQPELGSLFNEADHYDMREVIRRCQVAYIRGLNGNMKDYLSLKFKRINVDLKHIITDDAIKALADRLTDKDARGKKISNAYPLTVNNNIIRAMNLACEMGETLVTEEVVNAI